MENNTTYNPPNNEDLDPSVISEITNSYQGYGLFKDIADPVLRTRNRAVTLANIAESNMNEDKRITPRGASIMIRYMEKVPPEERTATTERFIAAMKERGYVLR